MQKIVMCVVLFVALSVFQVLAFDYIDGSINPTRPLASEAHELDSTEMDLQMIHRQQARIIKLLTARDIRGDKADDEQH